MSNSAPSSQKESRLQSLLSFLKEDPDNQSLLIEAAEQAIQEGDVQIANELLDRHQQLSPFDTSMIDRLGHAAIKHRCFAFAINLYETTLSDEPAAPSVKYNLAYSHAMQGDLERAIELLDEDTTAKIPQAAMLMVQILHGQGKFDEALQKGKAYLERFPDHEGLNAAMSVLALDVEDVDLARKTASRSNQRSESLTTLGTLALGENDTDIAIDYFDHAISLNPNGPRSWIGRGLAHLSLGDNASATQDIDHGAELFEDHIGSWIAAGWAHFVTGDLQKSRERFQRAFDIDNTFAESLGSLSVIDAIEGKTAEAERRSLTALRLDRECFSATLAQTLLLSEAGHSETARHLFEKALTTPIGQDQRTIVDFIARVSL